MAIHITKKAQLLAEIQRTWAELEATLDGLSEVVLSEVLDAGGWSIKDHLAHMTAWERGCVCFLEGKPRHEGLDIPQALYLSGDEQAMNVAMHAGQKDLPLTEVLEERRSTHRELLRLLEPLSEQDLQKTYREFMPDEPGSRDGTPALQVVYSETAHHFSEHLPWIQALTHPG